MKERLAKQRKYAAELKKKPIEWRLEQLQYLRVALEQYERPLSEALAADLGKSAFETYVTEIAMVYEEIDYMCKHLKDWVKVRKVKTPITQMPAKSVIVTEPRGLVLIMAPWNYPVQLTLSPMVAAIAAGNAVALKPSEYAVQTTKVLAEMLAATFSAEYIGVYEGDVAVCQALLAEPFDYIFYTGSTAVGKVVMTAAAQHLTPVTLELGGKSPCIVDRTADLAMTAKRIMWGKLLNAGQTCVAPDYLLVHTDIKEALIKELEKATLALYPGDIFANPDYPRIINEKHFDRLVAMLDMGKSVFGGEYRRDRLQIAPTVLDQARLDSPLMREEIFGPLLPVLNFEMVEDAIALINRRPKPLALYLFSEDQALQQQIMAEVSFGGGCINDTVMHLSNPRMPFGGVGASGMGAYHGKSGFDIFSHEKSVLKKSTKREVDLRYPPYGDKLGMVKKILKRI